ncbi:nucleotidyltransferase family protein [Acidobacteriia bacterium AH_259_A11_L15]|nr:nucleotidyltransferase family protein [Acidobacteriia bacterium AH_259_A11_L15]
MGLESQYADITLRLLLRRERTGPSDGFRIGDLAHVDWDVVLLFVQKNLITIRMFQALQEFGVPIRHQAYRDMVESERGRISRTMELIGRISEMLEGEGVEFVLTKSFQHYPDMGHDVDLFVLDRSARVDMLIKSAFRASISKESLSHKLAGKQGYEIDGYPSPVEIHHGRFGHVGEHNLYPQVLMRNRQQVTVDGITTFIASREDQLIVQAMQRIYSHLYIRLSDVVHTVSVIRRGDLDWDYVVGTAKRIGIFDGLSCYVSYVNQIYSRLFQTDVVSPEIGKLLVRGGVGKVRFKGWHYHFPIVLTVSRVYSRQFFATVGSLNWEGAARLCLLPPLTALAGFRILARHGARISGLKAFGSSRVEGGV